MIIKKDTAYINSAITDYEFVAIADNTTGFTISSAYYDFANDRLDIFYQGIRLKVAEHYTLAENVVTLGFSINTDDSVQYTITKTV